MVFDLLTSTGVLFTYTAHIPDPTAAQMVEFSVDSPFTSNAPVIVVNVATLARLGKSVETVLVEHVELYERRSRADRDGT
jgi:hypothetical protein